MLSGRVLITGGTGYLGRGILRRAKRENWPCTFTIYSRDEMKQSVAKRDYPDARFVLGDVRDLDRLETTFVGHDTVIHTAAVKFIPEAEFNVSECIDVNVQGSRNVVMAARRAAVKNVVAISTDKAVNPVNVYGATKLLMERIFSEPSQDLSTKFNTVRYGNVVGSTGSVIPLFEEQLKKTGRIKLTDGNMTRFWISIDEAIDLILLALNPRIFPGSVVIPNPRSMKMIDLVMAIAGDYHCIDTIGLRPGEKMHEALMGEQESIRVHYPEPNYFELRKPGTSINISEPFTLTSDCPASWVTEEELHTMIRDAASV